MNESISPKPTSTRPPSLVKNTAVITTVSCLERVLGFLYRIVLARLLGAEGLGLYQIALSHNLLFQTSSRGGIPVTLSRTVSRLNADGKSDRSGGALIAATLLGLSIALPVTLILLPFAEYIPFFKGDASVLKILILSLIVNSADAAVTGYFWGNKEFFPTSMFEMAEQIITVSLGVLFLSGAGSLSPVRGAERAAWAHTLGCVISFAIALAVLLRRKPKFTSPKPFFKPLFRTATPITAVRVAATATGAAVAVLFPFALSQAGMSSAAALQAFGVVTGMVMPLLYAPLTIIGSLAIVLIPELSEAAARRDGKKLQRNTERSLLFSLAIPCLLFPFFHALGASLGALAYQNALAGEMLSRCAILLVPLSLNAILMSILNSLGYERKTLMLSIFGSVAFVAGIFLLTKFVGVYAFPISLFLQLAIELIFGFRLLQKRCPLSRNFARRALFYLLATLPLCALGRYFFSLFSRFFGEWLTPIFAGSLLIAVIAAVYFLVKFFFLMKNGKKNLYPLDIRENIR